VSSEACARREAGRRPWMYRRTLPRASVPRPIQSGGNRRTPKRWRGPSRPPVPHRPLHDPRFLAFHPPSLPDRRLRPPRGTRPDGYAPAGAHDVYRGDRSGGSVAPPALGHHRLNSAVPPARSGKAPPHPPPLRAVSTIPRPRRALPPHSPFPSLRSWRLCVSPTSPHPPRQQSVRISVHQWYIQPIHRINDHCPSVVQSEVPRATPTLYPSCSSLVSPVPP